MNHLPVSADGTWCFYDGMLLDSPAKWWADFGTRKSRHEGLDIAMYHDTVHGPTWLHHRLKVPAMAGGTILNMCRDFLGQTVVVQYQRCPHTRSRIVVAYAHIRADSRLAIGACLERGDLLGTLADTANRKSGIPCHLHLSVMEITDDIEDKDLNWNLFTTPLPQGIILYNPWWFSPHKPVPGIGHATQVSTAAPNALQSPARVPVPPELSPLKSEGNG